MKTLKLLIVPLALIFGYLVFVSYPYFFSKINSSDSLGLFSAIEENPVSIYKPTQLLKGEKISTKVKASDNNFGIVLIKFVKFGSGVDRIAFRIKEEGKEKWHYEHYDYRAEEFQINQYFTFGFPPITDSKNKTYVFEIESLRGGKHGVGISPERPHVALVYKYNRGDLVGFSTLSSFISKKTSYLFGNVNFEDYWQILVATLSLYALILLMIKQKIKFIKKGKLDLGLLGKSLERMKSKIAIRFSRKLTNHLYKTRFYSLFLNTLLKKRLAIGLSIFLFALLYRFSQASVDQLGVFSFYAGLGGQGDYDQFIRAATCALKFCPAILGQNFLIESSILGLFYEIWGFVGGLKAYLYLMIILSSIVAVLPYFILSRKNFLTIGGIIGSLFLATSDYLTNMAIALPPDNGSLFTFSVFYIVYLLTLNIGTIRWLLFFGLIGVIDGLNKLILLMNDLAVLVLFAPIFILEKTKRIKKFPFLRLNLRVVLYSIAPFLVFLVIYSAWEYIVQIKFSTPYYLRALIEGGSTYSSSTNEASAAFSESLKKGNILEILYYYAGSYIVMQKRIIENAGLNTMLLAPILIGLLFATFRKPTLAKSGIHLSTKKLISILIPSGITIVILVLFRENFLDIHKVGQYVYAWPDSVYINVFLATIILFLFIFNFRYKAFKLALPIIPYVIMIIILTKNAPWLRMLAHIIVWNVILFSFLADWILNNSHKNNVIKKMWIGPVVLILFIIFYTIPKTSSMVVKLNDGLSVARSEVKYLKWVNSEIPNNAIILAGGKSDLVTVAEEIKKPIIYNSTWTQALLIKPKEIPGAKPADFAILSQLKMSEIPGVAPSDFNILRELKSEENFAKNKYLVLEDDIYLWRDRLADVADNVFATTSATQLHPNNYSIKVYKFNSALNKGIYELNLKKTSDL